MSHFSKNVTEVGWLKIVDLSELSVKMLHFLKVHKNVTLCNILEFKNGTPLFSHVSFLIAKLPFIYLAYFIKWDTEM